MSNQYMVPGSSEHDSPPITTRPGPPPKGTNFFLFANFISSKPASKRKSGLQATAKIKLQIN